MLKFIAILSLFMSVHAIEYGEYPLHSVSKKQNKKQPFYSLASVANYFDCTYFFIEKDVLLTAAHCVYDQEHDALSHERLGFYPNLNSGWLFGKDYVEEDSIFVPREYRLAKDVQYDFAVIMLDNYEKADYGVLSLNQNPQAHYENAMIAGYPRKGKGYKMYYSECPIGETELGDFSVYDFQCDTQSGMSGSPILVKNELGEFEVVGIHSGGVEEGDEDLNTGVKLTPEKIKLIKDFINNFRGASRD